MTQTYGYFCLKCNKRYRISSCKDGKDPKGHSLDDCYYIYRQNFKESFRIIISGPNEFHLSKYFSKNSVDLGNNQKAFVRSSRMFDRWLEEKIKDMPELKTVFENCRQTWSSSY